MFISTKWNVSGCSFLVEFAPAIFALYASVHLLFVLLQLGHFLSCVHGLLHRFWLLVSSCCASWFSLVGVSSLSAILLAPYLAGIESRKGFLLVQHGSILPTCSHGQPELHRLQLPLACLWRRSTGNSRRSFFCQTSFLRHLFDSCFLLRCDDPLGLCVEFFSFLYKNFDANWRMLLISFVIEFPSARSTFLKILLWLVLITTVPKSVILESLRRQGVVAWSSRSDGIKTNISARVVVIPHLPTKSTLHFLTWWTPFNAIWLTAAQLRLGVLHCITTDFLCAATWILVRIVRVICCSWCRRCGHAASWALPLNCILVRFIAHVARISLLPLSTSFTRWWSQLWLAIGVAAVPLHQFLAARWRSRLL